MDERCRAIEIRGGKEWICIKAPHDDQDPWVDDRPLSAWNNRHGFTARLEIPRSRAALPSERHIYVRRWPNSDR